MHSIHHAAVRTEDDRMGRIDLRDETSMVDHRAHRGEVQISIEPVDGVDLGDRVEWNLLHRKTGGQLDQAIDVPRVYTLSIHGLPEVVLLSHTVESHTVAHPAEPGRTSRRVLDRGTPLFRGGREHPARQPERVPQSGRSGWFGELDDVAVEIAEACAAAPWFLTGFVEEDGTGIDGALQCSVEVVNAEADLCS